MRTAFVLCCSVALLGTVGTASAQDWTKSKWGPNDEIGAANVFPAKEQAIAAIYAKLDAAKCAACAARIFNECQVTLVF